MGGSALPQLGARQVVSLWRWARDGHGQLSLTIEAVGIVFVLS